MSTSDAESNTSHSNPTSGSTSRYSTIKPRFLANSDQLGQLRSASRSSRHRNTNGERDYLIPPALIRSRQSYTALATRDLGHADVWGIVHRIRRDIKKCIETALTYEQINSPRLVFSVMRPLQDVYMKLNSPCTIFALLLNRVHFSSQQYTLSSLSVNNTRAMVCEILAVKILRALYDDDTSENGIFRLCILLATSFSPLQGAPAWAVPDQFRQSQHTTPTKGSQANNQDRRLAISALELAIVSESKRFIRAIPTQKVIMSIWTGKIVYSSQSLRYLIKDQYKKRPIMKYDVKTAPFLDHYRLRVPRIRSALEWLHFAVLFVAYLAVLRNMRPHRMTGWEIFWIVYGFGFALDKVASLMELGWTVFASNLWNGLDFVFVIMFIVYLPLRLVGLQAGHDTAASEALSILTCAGCVLFPRFAFVTLSDNLLILSLRSMLAQFARLMVLAVWCFAGFFVAFVTLGGGKYQPGEITQWMVWIWFGLDATGMIKATHLHNVLGPVLMVVYACLSNTLLVTVLVSILSNTFNAINSDALAEQMYRKAVSTIQGVKSDGIFSFQPPINILALFVLWPLRFFMDAHHYHQTIVFCARVSNAPLLIVIRIVERYFLLASYHDHSVTDEDGKPSWKRFLPNVFSQPSHTNFDCIFENEDDIDDDALPGGAFSMQDGVMTPDPERENDFSRQLGMDHNGSGSAARTPVSQQQRSDSRTRVASPSPMSARPGTASAAPPATEQFQRRERLQDRKRRGYSMSEWGGTLSSSSPFGGGGGDSDGEGSGNGNGPRGGNVKSRPTILSKLYGPKRESIWAAAAAFGDHNRETEEEREALKEQLHRIEEGQRRIEEALKGLGGGDGD